MTAIGCLQRMTVGAVVGLLLLQAAHAADHSHVRLWLEVGTENTGASGDALGVYAAQLVPCAATAARRLPPDQTAAWQVFAERLLGSMIGAAHANHRDRFEGLAAGEFRKRVELDRAGVTLIGDIIAPAAHYCRVLLTLARLPALDDAPELPFSMRLSTPTGREIKLEFRESLAVSLDKPWLANGRSVKLIITLRPRPAAELIVENMDDFGAVSQRVVAQLARASSARITER